MSHVRDILCLCAKRVLVHNRYVELRFPSMLIVLEIKLISIYMNVVPLSTIDPMQKWLPLYHSFVRILN